MLSATNPLTSVADSGSETVSVQVGDMDSSSDLTIAVNQEILNASSAFVGPERSHEEAVRIIERHRDEMRLLWTNGLNSSATLDSGESEVSNASTVEQSALTICQVYVEVIDSISPLSMFASSGGSGGGSSGGSGGSEASGGVVNSSCGNSDNSNTAPVYNFYFGVLTGALDASWGPTWNIEYYSSETYDEYSPSTWGINHALNYKLGAMVAHACYSQSITVDCGQNNSGTIIQSDAVQLVANASYFWGSHNTANSFDLIATASLWGCAENINGAWNPGGKQGTKITESVSVQGIMFPQ